MISIRVEKDSASFKKIMVNGHAMYDEYGKDIVCSAVSSIVTTTINASLALNEKSLKYHSEEGNVEIYDILKDHTTTVLLQNMLNLLQELENNYPDNIQIK